MRVSFTVTERRGPFPYVQGIVNCEVQHELLRPTCFNLRGTQYEVPKSLPEVGTKPLKNLAEFCTRIEAGMDRTRQRARTSEVSGVLVVGTPINQMIIGMDHYPLCTSIEGLRTAVDWLVNDPLTKKRTHKDPELGKVYEDGFAEYIQDILQRLAVLVGARTVDPIQYNVWENEEHKTDEEIWEVK